MQRGGRTHQARILWRSPSSSRRHRGALVARLARSAAPAAALALCAVLTACHPDTAFREAFARSTAQLQGEELLAALLALDQEYPDRLMLKTNIGALYLAQGDASRAAPYLERGEGLALRSRDPHLGYLLYANLAELALRTERYRDSVDHATRALRLQPEDPLGAIFTRAKAHLAAGQGDTALRDFRAATQTLPQRRTMNPEDYCAYIGALVAAGELGEALDLYRERHRRFGFATGQGLEESALFERLGRIDEAILSAFMELEYGQAHGTLDRATLRRNIAELSDKLEEGAERPSSRTGSLLSALDRYADEDWPGASASLAELHGVPEHPFLELLRATVNLELLGATPAAQPASSAGLSASPGVQPASPASPGGDATDWPTALARYLALEELFDDLQSYYYHLWRGMRFAARGYSLAVAQPVLEKTILLGPASAQAVETRTELGRLLGLPPDQGRRLLLEPEIRAAAAAATAGREPSLIEPLVELVGLPDTIYGLQATFVLQEAAADPLVRTYLERRRLEASGRLRERLDALLGT